MPNAAVIAPTVLGTTPRSVPARPLCATPDRPVHRVEEHDGGAVRHQDRERGAGHRGDHGVGRGERGGRVRDAVMPPAGQRGRDDRDAVGMPLVGDGQPVHAERRRQAAPVLRHRLRVVPHVPAEVKAVVDARLTPPCRVVTTAVTCAELKGNARNGRVSAHHSTLILGNT